MDQAHNQLFPFAEDKGKRLDVFLTNSLRAVSRERAKALISSGKISINGVIIQKPDHTLKGGESIQVGTLDDETPVLSPPPEFIPLPVLYEDDHIMIVNKPAGVSTHPTPVALHNSVLNGLFFMNKALSDMGDPMRRGIVHRLDKQTCGLLIIAKNNESHINLLKMFKQRTIHKTYIAVTYNVMKEQTGIIDTFIGRHPVDRKKMTTKTMRGRRAVTSFRVLKMFDDATVVELSPRTGRTHQLRTQLSDKGYPIINDTLYSKKKPRFRSLQLQKMVLLLDGIALFAYALSFMHPIFGTQMSFSAPFPLWLKEVLKEDELS